MFGVNDVTPDFVDFDDVTYAQQKMLTGIISYIFLKTCWIHFIFGKLVDTNLKFVLNQNKNS